MKNFLRTLILRMLGIDGYQQRLLDLEKHFVTKYTKEGLVAETLADVPVERRGELKQPKTSGMSWPQRQKWLEATDGGTRAPVGMRLPSSS